MRKSLLTSLFTMMATCYLQHDFKRQKNLLNLVKPIFSFKPFGFDNEQVISHQKLINSWVAKAPMIPYILCKNVIFSKQNRCSEIIWYIGLTFSGVTHYAM